jgi:hypothetical protein
MHRAALAAALLTVVLAPVATPSSERPTEQPTGRLQSYFATITPAVRSYRLLLGRIESAVSQPPISNVDPLVEKFNGFARDFDSLAERWGRLTSARGLHARHRDMGNAFSLEAKAFAVEATAIATRDPDVIVGVSDHVEGLFRSAAYLQKRWAAALRGALRRARLPVPVWLRGMATAELP